MAMHEGPLCGVLSGCSGLLYAICMKAVPKVIATRGSRAAPAHNRSFDIPARNIDN